MILLLESCTLPLDLLKKEICQLRAPRTGRRIDRYVGRLKQHYAQAGGSVGGETVKESFWIVDYGNDNLGLAQWF